jgi:cellulose synthase (UDP-forming)
MRAFTVTPPTSPNEKEKYEYININPTIIRILLSLSILSWFIVLRGFVLFLDNHIWYWLIFGPLMFYMFFFQVFSILINLKLPKFDLDKHEIKKIDYWNNIYLMPTVDIFLPVCGEELNILRNTWEGVSDLKNQLYKINPIVLDDKGSKEVESLAKEFNFTYLSRPNKGEMKKAGNLKFGYEHSNGDFIIIFDADFRPRHDFILEALPYMEDSKVGIIQTPQYFDNTNEVHKYSPLMAGAGNIQEYFYKVIQPARDTVGGAICVGTSAIYRRKALDTIGGTVQIEHSEDVNTGFGVINNGYKLRYLPIVLSKGVCPDNVHSFFKQQTRWCLGSLTLLTNKDFWRSKLSIIIKLCYLSGFGFYISNLVGMLLTFQTLILIIVDANKFTLESFYWFIPTIILSLILQLTYIYKNPKLGTLVAHTVSYWSYIFTILGMLVGYQEGWSASGEKVKVSKGFLMIYRMMNIYLIVYLGSVVTLLFFNKIKLNTFNTAPVLIWILVNIFYNTLGWSYMNTFMKNSYINLVSSKRVKTVFAIQRITISLLVVSFIYLVADRLTNYQFSTKLLALIFNIS